MSPNFVPDFRKRGRGTQEGTIYRAPTARWDAVRIGRRFGERGGVGGARGLGALADGDWRALWRRLLDAMVTIEEGRASPAPTRGSLAGQKMVIAGVWEEGGLATFEFWGRRSGWGPGKREILGSRRGGKNPKTQVPDSPRLRRSEQAGTWRRTMPFPPPNVAGEFANCVPALPNVCKGVP
jgi:hypothetical protein